MQSNSPDQRASGTGAPGLGRADVELRLPADGAYVAVVRTTTAGLAARLDFTVDDIEDLRIAMGEACSLVLDAARDGADLTARFWLHAGELVVSVAAETDGRAAVPDPDGFAWMVLTTLAGDAQVSAAEELLAITLTARPTPLETQPGAGL